MRLPVIPCPVCWPALRCALLLLLLACVPGLVACDPGGGDAGPGWTLSLEGLDGALISVAGREADDVWLVGADTRDGDGALILHFDGTRFTRELSGEETNLWWVHVLDDVEFMGGEGGTILRHDDDGFELQETPGDGTVFGIWGLSEDDLWAVGGLPEGPPGFIWRYDGESWRDVTDELPDTGDLLPPVFKAFGLAADDVMFVGNDGICFHYDGDGFEAIDSGTTRRLFTIHGEATGEPRYAAVGGFGSAVLIEGDGTSFTDAVPDDGETFQLFGVRLTGDGEGYAVGLDGLVLRRDAEHGWQPEATGVELTYPFHAVWVDPDGGVWAVGGNVLTPDLDQGMLLHRGSEIPNEIED